jgi:glycosyltransferase involved in cell wall biosynthesis
LNEALTPIVLTKWYQGFIREKRGIESKVLYNNVAQNIRLFRTSRPQEFYFIYIGRNHASKGYNEFLNCVKTFPEIQFVSVGPNPVNTFHNLKEHGWVSREETWEILSRSSCLVAPYKGLETFGMTVYESLALGVPVISSDIYSIREVFAQRPGVYIYSKESTVETCIREHMNEIMCLDRRALINNFDSFESVNNSWDLTNLWRV